MNYTDKNGRALDVGDHVVTSEAARFEGTVRGFKDGYVEVRLPGGETIREADDLTKIDGDQPLTVTLRGGDEVLAILWPFYGFCSR
jgi:hypothetical protein